MSQFRARSLLAALVALTVAACNGTDDGPTGNTTPSATPTSIVVFPDSTSVHVGVTQQLTATVLDQNGAQMTGQSVSFTSADQTIADVTPGGLLTGRKIGKTTVTATSGTLHSSVPVVVEPASGPATTIVAVLPVPGCPYGVAVAPNGVGFVTDICGNTVTRLDAAAIAVGAPVTVQSLPAHVALNPTGTTAYVVNQGSGSLSIIDVATNLTVKTIALGQEGYNVKVSPDGSTIYVTTAGSTVHVVSAATRAIVASFSVGAGNNGLAFHPTQPILYVSARNAGTVSAIDTRTNGVLATYPVGGIPQRIAVSADGTELFVANEVSGVDVINLVTGQKTSSIGIGGPGLGLAITPDGNYLYVGMPNRGTVQVIDAHTHAIYRTLTVGVDPRNIAIAPNGTVLVADQAGFVEVLR